MKEKKKLYRDTEHQEIFGVCAGLADYFGMDVTMVRLIAVFLVLFGGMSLWVYIILAIVIEPKKIVEAKEQEEIHKRETVNYDDDPFAKYDKKQ